MAFEMFLNFLLFILSFLRNCSGLSLLKSHHTFAKLVSTVKRVYFVVLVQMVVFWLMLTLLLGFGQHPNLYLGVGVEGLSFTGIKRWRK